MVILCDGEGHSRKVPEHIVYLRCVQCHMAFPQDDVRVSDDCCGPVLRDLLRAKKTSRTAGRPQKIDVEHDIEDLALMLEYLSAYSDTEEDKTSRYPATSKIEGLIAMSRHYEVFTFIERGLISMTIDYLNDDIEHTILKCLVVGIKLQSTVVVRYVLQALDDDSHPLDWKPSTVRVLGVYAYQLLLRGYQREFGSRYGKRGIWEAMAERMDIEELFKEQNSDDSMDESDEED